MTTDEIVKALRWLAKETEFIFAAENLNGAADLIESLQAQLADYHHMSELVDGKMAENQRLRRINENLQERLSASRRRGKAAVDTVEVVRCCDCVHFSECLVTENDYCSKGERKETD